MTIPWIERPFASLAAYENGYPFKPDDLSVTGTRIVRIRQLNDLSSEFDYFDGHLDDRYRLRDGDLVFSWSGSLCAAIWRRGDAYLNQHLFRVDPVPGVDRRWLAHALNWGIQHFQGFMHGSAMTHITKPMLKAVRVPVPPLGKQAAIADYLDRETARIDTLIEEQQRLVELMRERRSAVVATTVARGWQREVPMRPSEGSWFGDHPKHWESRPIRHCGELITGSTPPTDDPRNYAEEPNPRPWVRPQDLSAQTTASAWLTDHGWSGLRRVPSGSVLVGCIAYSLGRVGYVDRDVTTNQQITAIVPTQDGKFLYYVLLAAHDALWAASQMNRVPILNNQKLGSILIPIPPLDEQRRIAVYLDEQIAKIDTLITETERFIELAQERRTALITAAVTGQIDVRGAA